MNEVAKRIIFVINQSDEPLTESQEALVDGVVRQYFADIAERFIDLAAEELGNSPSVG
jgi:hypothetical protein